MIHQIVALTIFRLYAIGCISPDPLVLESLSSSSFKVLILMSLLK